MPLRFLTAGESHGPGLVAILEGVPAGLPLLTEDVDRQLSRRQAGYGRGGRMKIERDRVVFQGGVRGGETLGAPIAMSVANLDFDNWGDRMGAAPFDAVPEPVTRPRPGHADLAGAVKYNRRDLRDVIERASARETAMRVAVGAVCGKLLAEVGIRVLSHVVSIGDVEVPSDASGSIGSIASIEALAARAEEDPVRCPDPDTSRRMCEAIHAASHAGETLGGVFEIVALGVPMGLGSYVQWDRRLDGRLAQALMSIPAIKGASIGIGWDAARVRGSEVHDPIAYESGAFIRQTNRAGGIEGGVTNGEPLVCRAAMKPLPTLRDTLPSIDLRTKEPAPALRERSDVCAVPAASVVGEAVVRIVIADALLEKFGGDSMDELRARVIAWREHVRGF